MKLIKVKLLEAQSGVVHLHSFANESSHWKATGTSPGC